MQDLKQLLVEAGQELPAFLRDLAGDTEEASTGHGDDKGCAYCSGLGHRITNCPKLAGINTKVHCFTKFSYQVLSWPNFFLLVS
ncbi:unnamed protein product [Cylicostephanus goldi]|uniref:CCHC-type domain-containing protein n=1 Tax=Cylicostephanus goldi TaxID=71465 RepID=A0A3P7N153_CYLGO|nr:unnamed protein product [Cylicostephanus goldi]